MWVKWDLINWGWNLAASSKVPFSMKMILTMSLPMCLFRSTYELKLILGHFYSILKQFCIFKMNLWVDKRPLVVCIQAHVWSIRVCFAHFQILLQSAFTFHASLCVLKRSTKFFKQKESNWKWLQRSYKSPLKVNQKGTQTEMR